MIVTLILQAVFPRKKMIIILDGAALSVVISLLVGQKTMKNIYDNVPWDVLVIVIGLGVFSTLFEKSRIFSVLSVRCAKFSKGNHFLLLVMFTTIMFFISAVLNNLTALMLLFPVLISILNSLGVTQKYIAVFFSLILVSCNLGGAATPIGDFPAILLMGTGVITFLNYLKMAFPLTLFIFLLLLSAAALFYFKKARIDTGKTEASFALLTMEKMYRQVKLDKSILTPGTMIFLIMFFLWMFGDRWGLSPDAVCLLGLVILLIIKHEKGEEILRNRVDFESVIYFASLFIMVSCLAGSGILKEIADHLSKSFQAPWSIVSMLMLLTGFSTAIFSAGPSMATMLPIARAIIENNHLPGDIIYIGLALSVCAGSSFFLTAATSGPLAQTFVEKAGLRTLEKEPVTFNFSTFLPYGALSFAVIQLVALGFVLLNV